MSSKVDDNENSFCPLCRTKEAIEVLGVQSFLGPVFTNKIPKPYVLTRCPNCNVVRAFNHT